MNEMKLLPEDRALQAEAPRTKAADALEAAAYAVTDLPRSQWPGFVALFFEILEDIDDRLTTSDIIEESISDIIEESIEVLQARRDAGRW